MDSKQVISKRLCVYQDEAVGAGSVPLSIRSKNLHVKKSSKYFMKGGIEIDLQLNDRDEILNIQLGPDILIDLQAMREGVEVGPLGLFPVHVLQLGNEFDPQEGGTLRFGFLRKIFVKESLTFTLKRFFSKWFGLRATPGKKQERDLLAAFSKHYGEQNWGSFDMAIRRTPSGGWALYKDSPEDSEKTVERIVARFDVNRAGIALGIKEMFCE